jgi:hypothetical protein
VRDVIAELGSTAREDTVHWQVREWVAALGKTKRLSYR